MEGKRAFGFLRPLFEKVGQLTGLIMTKTVVIDNLVIPANDFKEESLNVDNVNGYVPAGILGFATLLATTNGSLSTRVFINTCTLSNNSRIAYSVRNTASSQAKIKIEFKVLYVRNWGGQ